MIKQAFEKRWGVIGAAVGVLVFMYIPSAINSAFYNYAPIEWWVNVQEIKVSNIDLETMHQTIEIKREINREINGTPCQELYLVEEGESIGTELLQVPPSTSLADYEPKDNNVTVLPFDFWVKKGVADDLRAIIKPDKSYRWVWVIQFERPNGILEVKRYPTNTFVLSNEVD